MALQCTKMPRCWVFFCYHPHHPLSGRPTIMLQDTYLNPFTDFGFKRLFGEEANKHLLMSFLNVLLPDDAPKISQLSFSKNELFGQQIIDRKAIFDVYCKSADGQSFIVELQKAKQDFFKDRSVYYSTFPIQEQAQKGEWNFELQPVYTVGILDFVFKDEDPEHQNDVIHQARLTDLHGRVFYDKLTFIYITLPNFKKTEDQLETLQDKWLYAFKHLAYLDHIPHVFAQDSTIIDFFETAKIAAFGREEHQAYEQSLKYYRDLKNTTDTAARDGFNKGRAEGKAEGLAEGKAEGKAEGLEEGEAKGLEKGKAALRQEIEVKLLASGMTAEQVAVILGE